MHKQSDSPIVTFARGGEEFTLGRAGRDLALHRYGSTGLGLAPVSIASSDRITGDGTIVRGVRYEAREVYIPLRLSAPSTGELSAARRELTRLLAPHLGEVEIQIKDPATGSERMIRGLLKDGLDGDFGSGYYGYWQTLGLTFECSDPWWMGAEQLVELRINPGSKPFISTMVPFFPVTLAQSTVQGVFQVDIGGAGPVWPVWEIVGPGEDLTISNGRDVLEVGGSFTAGSLTRIDTATGQITPDRWTDVSLASRLFQLEPGPQTLTVSLVSATADTLVRLTYHERHLEGY